MSRAEIQRGPVLKLVGGEETPAPRAARREVAQENRLAASLSPYDARWIFAVDVAASLMGGRAAVLPAKARKRLLARADGMGLRPFDANLVIAVVQDAQRDGRALSREAQERLLLVPPADPSRANATGMRFVVALVLAAAMILGWAVWLKG